MRAVYNALILSEALAELELRGDLASAEVLRRVYPVGWQHVNFDGRDQFDEHAARLTGSAGAARFRVGGVWVSTRPRAWWAAVPRMMGNHPAPALHLVRRGIEPPAREAG